MVVLEWITTVVLLAGIGVSGLMRVAGNQRLYEPAEKLGYANLFLPIGIAEILGAAGVLIGAISRDLERDVSHWVSS